MAFLYSISLPTLISIQVKFITDYPSLRHNTTPLQYFSPRQSIRLLPTGRDTANPRPRKKQFSAKEGRAQSAMHPLFHRKSGGTRRDSLNSQPSCPIFLAPFVKPSDSSRPSHPCLAQGDRLTEYSNDRSFRQPAVPRRCTAIFDGKTRRGSRLYRVVA